MSKLTEQELESIRKEAEELYPGKIKKAGSFGVLTKAKREAHIAAVTAERERAKELVEALESIKNAPVPYNDREYVSWVETARINSINALNQYNNGK